MIVPIFLRPSISAEAVRKGIKKFFDSLLSNQTVVEIYKKEFIYHRPYTFAKIKEIPMAQNMSDGQLHLTDAEIRTELREEKQTVYFRRDKSIFTKQDIYGKITEKEETAYPEEQITVEKYYQLKGQGAIELV